jgi:hydrogenase nickel incorporation protein HypA/HybF
MNFSADYYMRKFKLDIDYEFILFIPLKGNHMHEASLVYSIFEEVQQHTASQESPQVTEIILEVGMFSNIEPLLLREAFEVLKLNTPFEKTNLHIDTITAEVRCFSCRGVYQPVEFPFYCPSCGHYGGEILKGHDLIIQRIEMEVPDHA